MAARVTRIGLMMVVVGAVLATACSPVPGVGVDVASARYSDTGELAVYRPADTTDAPIAVLAHGCCGDSADVGQLAHTLADHGAIVFAPSWTRFADGGGWPKSYEDVTCAVAYARARGSALGGSPQNVTLIAWSDGALVGAVVALSGGVPSARCEVEGSGAPDQFIALAGYFAVGPSGREPPGDPGVAALLDDRAARPASYVGADTALPITLIAARDDDLATESRRFARKLGRVGHAAELRLVPGSHTDVVNPRTRGGGRVVAELALQLGLPSSKNEPQP